MPVSISARARRDAIVTLATTVGLASVDELSERFGVTASTIRRDLATLQEQRKLTRTFGGAMAVAAHPEASLRQRLGEHFDAKRDIARRAAEAVQPGTSLFLDNGSTVAAFAHALPVDADLTVTTTSVGVVTDMADRDDVRLVMLGGEYRSLSNGFVGPLTEAALEYLTFDAAYLGADAVSPERGICEADLGQIRLKELIARRAAAVYVLADSSKLAQSEFHAWTRLGGGWTLVTDDGIAPDLVERFDTADVTVVTA
ncbi:MULTISPECIES: DeoR/GlpR family DNA-binding transcription regulator [unclassified Curtobacterium]|uniref:DeoR/GlpR family DNA-binding transcription regulator n=1 Tax=unclassified Curtobacterium TaxID=257496 RepID=UPI001B4241AA|nr:DeoR/GlpR family DNA-binding transcription regulator [Curtobacterium sp. 1310]MBP1301191.1 DeoR/GlpR family transcriptional regulator of sugar metabolism [Curtobacterium sp. 1310]